MPADANAAHWPDPDDEARTEEALAGTFPASDAPPWTRATWTLMLILVMLILLAGLRYVGG